MEPLPRKKKIGEIARQHLKSATFRRANFMNVHCVDLHLPITADRFSFPSQSDFRNQSVRRDDEAEEDVSSFNCGVNTLLFYGNKT